MAGGAGRRLGTPARRSQILVRVLSAVVPLVDRCHRVWEPRARYLGVCQGWGVRHGRPAHMCGPGYFLGVKVFQALAALRGLKH